jgi:hypothetical protein
MFPKPRSFLLKSIFSLLLIILPIQNLLGQLATNKLGLSPLILLWKEALVLIGCSLLLVDIWQHYQSRQKRSQLQDLSWSFPILLYLLLLILAGISSAVNQVPVREIVLGFRLELFWVGFFAVCSSWILAKLSFDPSSEFGFESFTKIIRRGVYIGYSLVFGVVLLSYFFGFQSFYSALGYADNWDSEGQILINSPICHSVDGSGNGCRLSAGFSSPNHFAA